MKNKEEIKQRGENFAVELVKEFGQPIEMELNEKKLRTHIAH